MRPNFRTKLAFPLPPDMGQSFRDGESFLYSQSPSICVHRKPAFFRKTITGNHCFKTYWMGPTPAIAWKHALEAKLTEKLNWLQAFYTKEVILLGILSNEKFWQSE